MPDRQTMKPRVMSEKLVPVAPLRDALQRTGRTPREVARALGWTRRDGNLSPPDDIRVRRDLGLRGTYDSKTPIRTRISYDRAVLYAEAIGVDPVEVGL